jgi:hypothetical protein
MSGLQIPTEDKFTDIVRGRHPVSDARQIASEWRRDGGNEARDFSMKVPRDNGRAWRPRKDRTGGRPDLTRRRRHLQGCR